MYRIFKIGIVLFCVLCSCNSKPRDLERFMVDVSEFSINNEVLNDGEYVEILGCSGNLTKNHKIDFYNLVVVKSEKTGDTINVLVTNFYQPDLANRRTRFISNTSLVGKIFEDASNSEEFVGKNIDSLKSKSYDKVFYDTEYIHGNVRKYQSITGNLGDYTIE